MRRLQMLAFTAAERNIVVGNQVTPVPIALDGAKHTIELPLEAIAAHAQKATATASSSCPQRPSTTPRRSPAS